MLNGAVREQSVCRRGRRVVQREDLGDLNVDR